MPDANPGGAASLPRLALVLPCYNEADNLGFVLDQIPDEVCGLPTAILVVDDGSRDGTEEVAAGHGAVVSRHVVNRGGGAARLRRSRP